MYDVLQLDIIGFLQVWILVEQVVMFVVIDVIVWLVGEWLFVVLCGGFNVVIGCQLILEIFVIVVLCGLLWFNFFDIVLVYGKVKVIK